MSNLKLCIIGAGGHATSLANVALSAGFKIHAFLDNHKAGQSVLGVPVLDEDTHLPACAGLPLALGLGDNHLRQSCYEAIMTRYPQAVFPPLVHASAVIGQDVSLGAGCQVMPGAIIGPCSHLGPGCLVNTRASLDHHGTMEAFSSLAPGAVTGGHVHIGARTAVSLAAAVKHGVRIGADSVLGANAYLHEDLGAGLVAYGTPARVQATRTRGQRYL